MLPSALPFFLKTHPGERFCLYHQPDPAQASRGAVLYVHPFAEELNRCRRMAALQSRAWAAAGYAVLQIDLYGCGDSSGDFGDAALPDWHSDLAVAIQWLRAKAGGPLVLWGIRLGALLALDHAAAGARAPDAVVLCQPVPDGAQHLKQFERVASAARITSGTAGRDCPPADRSTREIAGYRIAPELYDAVAALNARSLTPRAPVHWFESAIATGSPATQGERDGLRLPVASEQVIAGWRASGVTVVSHRYEGRPFWSSTEITECPALLSATATLLSQLSPQP